MDNTDGLMRRRNLFRGAMAAVAGAMATRAAHAEDSGDESKERVVYHLADAEKVGFVLGSITHHYEGVGGPGRATIALVVHGPALRAFMASTPNADIRRRFATLVAQGLRPMACIHTMTAMNLKLADLLPGFAVAEKGGVVALAALQREGYAYLRP